MAGKLGYYYFNIRSTTGERTISFTNIPVNQYLTAGFIFGNANGAAYFGMVYARQSTSMHVETIYKSSDISSAPNYSSSYDSTTNKWTLSATNMPAWGRYYLIMF
jgi:hypothetical protein